MTAELEPVAWRAYQGGFVHTSRPELAADWGDGAEPLVTLSSAQEAIDKREERIRELELERDEAFNVLACLSSYLGAGLGDENTTAAEYDKRIRWGIDDTQASTVQLCIRKVERASERPSTTWGELKSELALIVPGKHSNSRAEAAEALVDEAEKALEPFVSAFNKARDKYAARYRDAQIGFTNFDKMPDGWAMDGLTFNMGVFRAARSLAAKIKEAKG